MCGGGAGRIRTNLFPLDSRGEYQVVSYRPSWMAGAVALHPLSTHVAFRTGLYWSFISGHDEYWMKGQLYAEADRRIHYLCLPLLVQVEFHGVHLAAGYRAGFALHEDGTFITHNEEDDLYTTENLGLKRLDMGLAAELGYRVSDRIDLGIDYYYGVRDIKDHSDGYLSPLMNEQLVFVVGYRIIPRLQPKAREKEEPLPQEGK